MERFELFRRLVLTASCGLVLLTTSACETGIGQGLVTPLAWPRLSQESTGEPWAASARSDRTDEERESSRNVAINRTRLDDASLAGLCGMLGVDLPDGNYWYDNRSGSFGLWGGPALAFLPSNLDLGGPLPANASGGGTRVFVNGRELHADDVLGLSRILGPILPGRYWLDGQGNYGFEGGPVAGNLVALAQTQVQAQMQAQAGAMDYGQTGAAASDGGDGSWTRYRDYGGSNGKTHFGSFGDGDFYFSSGNTSWYPGK